VPMCGAGEQHPRTPSDDAVGTDVMAALEPADGRPGVAGEVAGVADAEAALHPPHGRPSGTDPQRAVRRPRTDCVTVGAAGGLGRTVREPACGLRTAYCPRGRRG